jgi:hypothetical protein
LFALAARAAPPASIEAALREACERFARHARPGRHRCSTATRPRSRHGAAVVRQISPTSADVIW